MDSKWKRMENESVRRTRKWSMSISMTRRRSTEVKRGGRTEQAWIARGMKKSRIKRKRTWIIR